MENTTTTITSAPFFTATTTTTTTASTTTTTASTATSLLLFDHFSFSSVGVPSGARIKSAIKAFKEEDGGYIETAEWLDDRYVTYFKRMQPQWLVSMARKIRMEFPGGFPVDHYAIHALLLEVKPGAAEQEIHSDGVDGGSLFWNIFVPLTRSSQLVHGTTVFESDSDDAGSQPSKWCRNYMFDSKTLHYGQANRSETTTRYVLLFIVGTVEAFGPSTL